jgi:hypothetical protein
MTTMMMTMNRLVRWMLCAAAIALVGVARPALAAPTRVALTRMPDDTTGLGKLIAGALTDGDLEVVTHKKVDRAIERLGIDAKLTANRDLDKLASELEVDAILKAAFEHNTHRLRFRIFANGKQGKPFLIAVNGDPDSDKLRTLVRKTLVAKLSAAVPADDKADKPDKPKHGAKSKDADDSAGEPVADAEQPGKAGKADKPKHAARPKGTEDTEDTAGGQAAGDKPAGDAATPASGNAHHAAKHVATHDDDDTLISTAELHAAAPALSGAHSANLDAVRVDLGASMTERTLKFQANAGLASPPMPYKNTPVPGGRVAGELYPFAFGDPSSALAGLGIAGDFDQVAKLTLWTSAETTVPLKATDRHYSVGVRYRIAFGHTPTSPTLTLGAGYEARTFTVDRKGLMSPTSLDLPDVDYRMYDPGLALRLPLGRHVAFTAEGRALLTTNAGPIQRPDQYGTAKITAGTASAGLELILGDRIAVRVAGEATQVDLKFSGNGMLSNSRDGNPATIDVHTATDRYLGGSATLAVLY